MNVVWHQRLRRAANSRVGPPMRHGNAKQRAASKAYRPAGVT